ncbi:MAG: T9SS type A sorting domain-containing protein [Bacteroidota bacterium]|nr:T9SS type A sorting domain-containing protein [Bacteroidota bacterium]
MKKILLLIALLNWQFFIIAQSIAPKVVSSSGGYYVGSNSSLSVTIGQPLSHTYNIGSNIITEGFQQPASIANTGTQLLICYWDTVNLTAPSTGMYRWSTGSRLQKISVNPTFTTTYKVTVTKTTGTSSVYSFVVGVVQLRAKTIPLKTICQGNSTILSVTDSFGSKINSYRWSTGETTQNITVTPLRTTSYTVTIDVNTPKYCASSALTDVKVNFLPKVNGITNISSCNNSSTVLSAVYPQSGDIYLWNTNATTSSVTVKPTVNTTYTLTIKNKYGCSASDEFDLKLVNCKNNDDLSLKDNELNTSFVSKNEIKEEAFSVYPNPFSQMSKISYSLADNSNLNISVYDLIGNKVSELEREFRKKGNYSLTWDRKGLKPGVYFIKFNTESKKQTYKVVIL